MVFVILMSNISASAISPEEILPDESAVIEAEDVLPEAEDETDSKSLANPIPIIDVHLIGSIKSSSSGESGGRVSEPIRLTRSGKSLWFADDHLVKNDITTHDNHGTVRHYKDEVKLVVHQEGQNGALYTMVNGVRKLLPEETKIVSSYPNILILELTYTVKREDIDPDDPYTIFTFGNVSPTGQGTAVPYTRFETNAYVYWDQEGKSRAPKTSFVYDAEHGQMLLSGADATMEYRALNDSAWKPCTNEPMYFNGSEKDRQFYLVRYAAANGKEASQTQKIELPVLRAAPSVYYDSATEMLSNLTTHMEFSVDNGAYQEISTDSMGVSDIIDSIPAETTKAINIRYKATPTQQAGVNRIITLYPRSEPPTSVVLNPTSLILSGYTAYSTQYKIGDDNQWQTLSGTSISLQKYAQQEQEVKVYVRTKAAKTTSASKPVVFTLPKLAPGPTGTLDYASECIVGLDNGDYQYSTSGTSWSKFTVTNNRWDISRLIYSYEKTIYIRKAETASSPISGATKILLPARAANPSDLAFDYSNSANGKVVLNGATLDMQYKKSNDVDWTDFTSNQDFVFELPSRSVSYQVRTRATDHSFASYYKGISLQGMASAPNCSYNPTTEVIAYLANTMEVKIGNGAYAPATEKTFSTSNLIDNLAAGDSVTVSIRKAPTQTTPVGQDRVFTLYARSAPPSTLQHDVQGNLIQGCSSGMQYRLEDSTSWYSISGSTLKVERYASKEKDVRIYIRMKPTNNSSASKPVEFIIPKIVTLSPSNMDEMIVEPGETVVEPGETVVEPDETVVEPGETVVEPDETVVEPDEMVIDPEVTIL